MALEKKKGKGVLLSRGFVIKFRVSIQFGTHRSLYTTIVGANAHIVTKYIINGGRRFH